MAGFQGSVESDELKTGGRGGIEQARQDLENDRLAGSAHRAVPVVHQQDRAGSKSVQQARGALARVVAARIEAAPRPGSQAQAEPGKHRVEERIAQAGGRAEESRTAGGDGGQGFLAREEFLL